MNMIEIERALRELRLSGIAETLSTRVMQAQAAQQPFLETFSAMLQDELVDADRKLTHLRALCRLKTDPGVLLTLPKFWAGDKEGDYHGNVGKNSADVPARQAVAA